MPRYVKVPDWPPDHARKAYREKYFFEAMQTLHSWLECKLRELLLLQRTLAGADHSGWARSWDISNEFTLNNAAKALFILGAITEAELARIVDFNRVRNNIVHKLFWDPYNESWKGVLKEEYDRAFKAGLKLCEEIEFKSGEVVAITDPSNEALLPTPVLTRRRGKA